jgi:hypothetical protein
LNAYFKTNPGESSERTTAEHLRFVCNAFIQAQQRRNDADYNTAKECTRMEVEIQIRAVTQAFQSWNIIRDEGVAQAWLVSLFGSNERREKTANPPKTGKSRKNKPQPPPTAE